MKRNPSWQWPRVERLYFEAETEHTTVFRDEEGRLVVLERDGEDYWLHRSRKLRGSGLGVEVGEAAPAGADCV